MIHGLRLSHEPVLNLLITSTRITGIVNSYYYSPWFDSCFYSSIVPLAFSFIHILPSVGLQIRGLSLNMFFCGSDYRFHFEIVVVLVIALIIYVFISIAWIVGQSLWRIQEKVNQHDFTIADRKYASQSCQCQRTSWAISTNDAHLRCGNTVVDEVEKLRKTLKEKEEEVERVCKKLKDKYEDVGSAGEKREGKNGELAEAREKVKGKNAELAEAREEALEKVKVKNAELEEARGKAEEARKKLKIRIKEVDEARNDLRVIKKNLSSLCEDITEFKDDSDKKKSDGVRGKFKAQIEKIQPVLQAMSDY